MLRLLQRQVPRSHAVRLRSMSHCSVGLSILANKCSRILSRKQLLWKRNEKHWIVTLDELFGTLLARHGRQPTQQTPLEERLRTLKAMDIEPWAEPIIID